MKKLYLALGIALILALGSVFLPNSLSGQTNGEVPKCDETCEVFCGSPTMDFCTYTYCEDEDGNKGTESCYGEKVEPVE